MKCMEKMHKRGGELSPETIARLEKEDKRVHKKEH